MGIVYYKTSCYLYLTFHWFHTYWCMHTMIPIATANHQMIRRYSLFAVKECAITVILGINSIVIYTYYIYSMMETSSLWCGKFCILYIALPCAHYAGDVTIIQYIVYSMLIGPIYCI